MSPRFLLDTSTISEPMKKTPDEVVVRVTRDHDRQDRPIVIAKIAAS